LVYGEDKKVLIGGSYDKGAFFSPLLFRNEKPLSHLEAHTIEAFGPVSTLMPYQNTQEAYKLVRLGEGSLVCSLVTMDMDFAQEFVMECGSLHGRILILNEECASESTGHGSPLPSLVHGGPGRAGGGEEMGGVRGVKHYMQRTA